MPISAEAPSLRYYQSVEGRWLGSMQLSAAHSGGGLLARLLARAAGLFSPLQTETSVDAAPGDLHDPHPIADRRSPKVQYVNLKGTFMLLTDLQVHVRANLHVTPEAEPSPEVSFGRAWAPSMGIHAK